MDEGAAEVNAFEAVFFRLEGGDLADVIAGSLVKTSLKESKKRKEGTGEQAVGAWRWIRGRRVTKRKPEDKRARKG